MDIVIVGGGTAGWIAAYSIINAQPNKHNIIVVESSKIGILGSGEASTGQMLKLLKGGFFKNKKSINIDDFLQKTDSINKMVIRFENWSGIGSSHLVPVATSLTQHKDNDYILKYVISKFGSQNVHLSSKDGIAYEAKKYDEYLAFHFDAHKVGEYFKNQCENKVKVIDSVVTEINVLPNGHVDSLILDNKQIINGDFFIDCSGFSSIFMKKLDVNWKSCNQYLPVNTAMPFIIKHKENEELIPETKAIALSSGWMWDIPLTTRRGCGYVFDSNFITNDQAQEEVEKILKQDIEPIRFINFDSGYVEEFWKNNVLSLGLASSFFEPLQATSIHNTILQIFQFINNYLFDNIKETINDHNIKLYNKYIRDVMIGSLNLISLTYQGKRYDSEFWRHIVDNDIAPDKVKEYKEIQKTRFLVSDDVPHPNGGHNLDLINYMLSGLNLIPEDMALNSLQEENMYEFAEQEYQKYYRAYSYKKI